MKAGRKEGLCKRRFCKNPPLPGIAHCDACAATCLHCKGRFASHEKQDKYCKRACWMAARQASGQTSALVRNMAKVRWANKPTNSWKDAAERCLCPCPSCVTGRAAAIERQKARGEVKRVSPLEWSRRIRAARRNRNAEEQEVFW